MTVDVTYCLSMWEDYFTEKPLSFNEFVNTYENKEKIFPHILKKIDEISKQPSKLEYFIQGFVGSGKSTLIYLLIAYKVYLYLILKCPHELYEVPPSTRFCMVIYSPITESAGFMVEALMRFLEKLSFFKRVHTVKKSIDSKEKAMYTTAYPNSLLTFKKDNNILYVVPAENESDIIGLNPVIGVLTELDNFKQRGISIDNAFNFYQNLRQRINARCKGVLSTIILEKSSDNVWADIIDRMCYENFDPSKKIILFNNYWEVFRYKDPNAVIDSKFNVTACCVVEHEEDMFPGDVIIDFPSMFQGRNLFELAKKNPETFLKDIIGMPVGLKKQSSTLDIMKNIIKYIHNNNLEICFKNGTAYIECPNEKLSVSLADYQD